MSDARTQQIRWYVEQGWAPVPIPARSKNPGFDRWQEYVCDPATIDTAFAGGRNVGLILGERSNGLTDIDLDAPEARSLARLFLPPTGMVHGRDSKPASHWWYICNPPLEVRRYQDVGGQSLVEYRSTGGQTLVPPSMHESGEQFAWEIEGDPVEIDGRVLLGQVERLAACSLLARHWPAEGARHDAAMAAAGALLRHGWPADQVAEFVVAAARVAGDLELRDREAAVYSTADTLRTNSPATGLPRLADIIGDRAVDRFARWLGISRDEPLAPRLVLHTPATITRETWRQVLEDTPIPIGRLPYWMARIVQHIQPYTPMFPGDWPIMMALPYWSVFWPNARLQNLNLAIWSLGVGVQGTGKNVATDELQRIAQGVAPAAGNEMTLYTAGSPEGMWAKLAGTGKRMLAYHDEFGGYLKLLQRDHMSYARETLCSLYDGRSIGYQRASRDSIEVIDPHVAVIATVNKLDVEAHASLADLSNGYLSRFLVCAPDVVDELPEHYPFRHDPTTMALIDELSRHVQRYRDVQHIEWAESGRSDPELLNDYRAHLGVNSRRVINLDEVEDAPTVPAGRLLARVKKIAGLLALSEHDPEMSADQRVVLVRTEHLATALDIVERSRAYTERLASWIGVSEDVRLTVRVLKFVTAASQVGVSQRDICRRTKSSARDVQTALQLLESDGQVERRQDGRVERWYAIAA